MSLEVNIGKRGNILEVGPQNAAFRLFWSSPVRKGNTWFTIDKAIQAAVCEAADDLRCLLVNGSQLLVLSWIALEELVCAFGSKIWSLKILSKMGISLLSSYCGAQIFEIYGLGQEIADLAFSVEENIMEITQKCQNYCIKQFGQKNESAYSIYQQHLANRPVNVLLEISLSLEVTDHRSLLISGHDGGTGASPVSSIKHAGGPWELGLTETHQTLIENGLRERVILRVDGGFKSGVDVLMAAAMGADEYGFGSVAMIATGCREELRARFPGVPGDLVNYFLYVAEESAGLPKWSSTQIRNQEVHSNGPVLDDIFTFLIPRFTGSAGQSFGCFLTPGMNVRLVGEANDYVGKGMAGGELVVAPVENTGFCPEDATIVGNTCLYMVQLEVRYLLEGKAGERFAVRNSLAHKLWVGRNVAAGMTGGLSYILDEDDTLIPKVNKEIVRIQRVNAPAGQMQLKSLIEAHVRRRHSRGLCRSTESGCRESDSSVCLVVEASNPWISKLNRMYSLNNAIHATCTSSHRIGGPSIT
ncbi:hypothetical protein J5N97_014249 [Dioscorea zingiberensis]|uniref:Uncharacterized protein n=1 Tax=Dioscorea zingiberensis TaxID=325984 RepID=A0A9D5CUV5_9LILI|nr:hypothetical protein J5N97_014249 [Dioscorea zingiberensis]